MVYELITNNSHGNNLAIYKCYDSGRIFYKKVAFSRKANILLENEKKGYDWYLGGSQTPSQVRLTKKHFYELDMPEFEGRKFPANNPISGNEADIIRIIDRYRDKWLQSKDFAVHGDMALCNIIIGKNDINIVDWEHFHAADRSYFGFDIINLIFISLFYEYRKIESVRSKTTNFLASCYRNLMKGVDNSNKIISAPFESSSAYLKKFPERFALNRSAEEKFALAGYPVSILKKLDGLITES